MKILFGLFVICLMFASCAAQSRSGIYDRVEDEGGQGYVKLTETKRGKTTVLQFFMSVRGKRKEDGCAGAYKGKVKWIDSNTAEYSDGVSECHLKFIFSGDSVTIKEEDCYMFHAHNGCQFEGIYKRRARKKA